MTGIDQRPVADAEALNHLTPTAAAIYLVRAGWTRMGEGNGGTVWTRPLDGGVSHLFQPEDATSPDYARRMGEMRSTLALAEERPEPAVLTDPCGAEPDASRPAEEGVREAGRTDWMDPEYGLRRPELALVLDLSASRVDRAAFVLELEQLHWPLSEAAELADLVAECELSAAESARAAVQKAEERADGLG
jgi:hypothetical protein